MREPHRDDGFSFQRATPTETALIKIILTADHGLDESTAAIALQCALTKLARRHVHGESRSRRQVEKLHGLLLEHPKFF